MIRYLKVPHIDERLKALYVVESKEKKKSSVIRLSILI